MFSELGARRHLNEIFEFVLDEIRLGIDTTMKFFFDLNLKFATIIATNCSRCYIARELTLLTLSSPSLTLYAIICAFFIYSKLHLAINRLASLF